MALLLLESRSGATNGSWKLGLGGRQAGAGQVQCPGTLKTNEAAWPPATEEEALAAAPLTPGVGEAGGVGSGRRD